MPNIESLTKIFLNPANSGAYDIKAYRQYHKNDPVFLVNLEGWDTVEGLSLTTKPKMLGAGSYLTGVTYENRNVNMGFSSHHTDVLVLRQYLDIFRAHLMAQIGTPVESRIEIIFYENLETNILRKETLKAYLTGVSDIQEYNEGEDLVFTLNFTATNPTITIT